SHVAERSLATWMEAAAWAAPRGEGGRVLAQTLRPGHPALQALVRWEPMPLLLAEGTARAAAGFPPGAPVFRLEGGPGLPEAIGRTHPITILTTVAAARTVCLV